MTSLSRRAALGMGFAFLGGVMTAATPTAVAAQKNALRFELYRDSRKGFRWRLKSSNGRVLATGGEAYTTKAACREAIDRIREGASTAEVDDRT
ncbi:MAG: DUF1508 domain-containing protein [Gemmatimonadaceae bacterium]